MRKDTDIWRGTSVTPLESQLMYIHCGEWGGRQLRETRKTTRDADDQVHLRLWSDFYRRLNFLSASPMWPSALRLGAVRLWAAACGSLVCVVDSSGPQSGRGVMGTRSHHCYSHSLGEQVRRGRVSFNPLILTRRTRTGKSLTREATAQPKSFGSKVEIVQGSRNVDQEVALPFGFLWSRGMKSAVLCLQSDSQDLSLGPHICEHTQYAREFIRNL